MHANMYNNASNFITQHSLTHEHFLLETSSN